MSEAGAFRVEEKQYTLGDARVVILAAQWHENIVGQLTRDAVRILKQFANVEAEVLRVPGCYELPQAASMLIQQHAATNAAYQTDLGVICFGCVVKGETPHFDFISLAAAHSIEHIACETQTPIMFGVLTTNTVAQAEDRANGTHSRKGEEVAYALLEMMKLQQDLRS